MAAYDQHFPIAIAERPLRFPSQETKPASLVRSQLEQLFAAHRETVDALLVRLAHACFQIRETRKELAAGNVASAGESLEIIAADMEEQLEAHGVQMEGRAGEPWSAALRSAVAIRGHQVRDDLPEPRIAHVELPSVSRNGRLLAKGAVILEGPKLDEARIGEDRSEKDL